MAVVNYYPDVQDLTQGAVLPENEWPRQKIQMLIWVVAARSNRRPCGGAV
jgi:hypothetical protein